MGSTKSAKPSINLDTAFTELQAHLSSFFQNISNFQTKTKHTLSTTLTRLGVGDLIRLNGNSPPLARLVGSELRQDLNDSVSMTIEAIEERLAGVPVFALSNSDGEFMLVSGVSSGNSLGLFCFKEQDAEALLDQLKGMPLQTGASGSKIVPLALNKVFQLKVDGVAFRFVPDSSQVKNAIEVKEKEGVSDHGFTGVPVFQSRSLVLNSHGKSYRPMFFRKEDLDKSLQQALRDQRKLNPIFRHGDIQVAVFEEVIKSMKEGSNPEWNDAVFIPPGFDVRTNAQSSKSPENR